MSLLIAHLECIYQVKWGKDGGFEQDPQPVKRYQGGAPNTRIMMSRDTRHIWSISTKGVCCRQLDGVETGSTTFYPPSISSRSINYRIGSEGQLFRLTPRPKDVTCYSSDVNGKVTSEVMFPDCNMKYLPPTLLEDLDEEGVRDDMFPPYDKISVSLFAVIECLMWSDKPCYRMEVSGWKTDAHGVELDDSFWTKNLFVPLEGEPYLGDSLADPTLDEISFDCDVAGTIHFFHASQSVGFELDQKNSPKTSNPFPNKIGRGVSWIWEGDSKTLPGADSAVAVAEHRNLAERVGDLESHVEDLEGCLAHIQTMVSDLSKRD